MIVVPEFVKSAAEADVRGGASLTPTQWADPANKRYPLHTPAAVWTSAKEAAEDGVSDQVVLGKIAQAARLFAVEIPAVRSAEFAPHNAPPRLFALQVTRGDKTAASMPIETEADIRAAGYYLQKHAGSLPYELRQSAAENVLKRADELGTRLDPQISDWLHIQAGRGEYLVSIVKRACEARAALRPAFAEQFKGFAASITGGLSRDTRIKMAEAMTSIDKQTGISRCYSDECLTPEQALFGITHLAIKTAMETHVQLSTGVVFEKAAIKSIPEQSLRDWLGDAIVDDVSESIGGINHEKFAEALPILPKPDARRFADCARLHGVNPAA